MNPPLEFESAVSGSIFNLAGQYGVCVTGEHNITYQIVLADRAQLEALVAEIQEGRRKVEQVPHAVPLPALVLQLATVAGSALPSWRLGCRHPAQGPQETVESVQIASLRTPEFDGQLARFHELAATALAKAEERAALEGMATAIGEILTALIPEPERRHLAELGRAEGPPPFLVIESEEDAILSLPWELLRLAGEWSVRDGRLDVARCVPNSHGARLEPPTGPVSVHVNVCAPESEHAPGLSYEKESYRISRALQEHEGVRVNEMGELEDLLNVLCSEAPPTIIHFSGHGGRGVLLFEDEFGGGLEVSVHDLITRTRNKGVKRWPRLFYLSCCHGQTPAQRASAAGVSSTAARLHQEGIPEVLGHFGPVYDSQSTDAESAFYSALAAGQRTREALRAAAPPWPRRLRRDPAKGSGAMIRRATLPAKCPLPGRCWCSTTPARTIRWVGPSFGGWPTRLARRCAGGRRGCRLAGAPECCARGSLAGAANCTRCAAGCATARTPSWSRAWAAWARVSIAGKPTRFTPNGVTCRCHCGAPPSKTCPTRPRRCWRSSMCSSVRSLANSGMASSSPWPARCPIQRGAWVRC